MAALAYKYHSQRARKRKKAKLSFKALVSTGTASVNLALASAINRLPNTTSISHPKSPQHPSWFYVLKHGLHFKWEVEYMYGAPDCQEHVVMGINGQFPGPTIRAKAGDTIVVDLTNKLHTEGVVIHWHGIRQLGTPWADGTASISQCAINPGETFEYRFKVDRPGTYFYHGHYGMQRSAGLYGSLIVDMADGEKEPFHYDAEFNLLLSDWWHKSVHEQEVGLSSNPFRWIGEPQSLLINGRGQYNCSLAAKFSNSSISQCKFEGNEKCAPQVLKVRPNKTYRLRIASTTALASLNLAIE
ncbi:hypothetical protein Gotur_030123, partial [Gossypium turneri]